jgi:hypothetical protein
LRRAMRGSLLGVQRSPSGRCPFGLLALEAHTCARIRGLGTHRRTRGAPRAPLLSLSQEMLNLTRDILKLYNANNGLKCFFNRFCA